MEWPPERLRQLDKVIAEGIMGWQDLEWREEGLDLIEGWFQAGGWYGQGPNGEGRLLHSFATDRSAAWLVVEELLRTWSVGLAYHIDCFCICTLRRTDSSEDISATSESVPLAICLAAAKALGLEIPA